MRIRTVLITLGLLSFFCHPGWSQTDASELYARARSFIQSGDYSNAILVLNRAVQLAPENAQYRKQLAFSYYLNRNLTDAEKVIKDVLNSEAADVQTYQIAGNIYKAKGDVKGAEKNFKRGLKKFPESGVLYNELGLIYFNERKYTDALDNWTTGIRVAPDYSSNYYNAARTYYYSKDKIWAILYGETFICLERFTTRTAEIKKLLLDAYKELFSSGAALRPTLPTMGESGQATGTQPDFHQAVVNALSKGSGIVVTRGVTPQTLVMLRTRFVLEWSNFYKLMYPYALFDYQQKILRAGLFEAYNEWLFGPADNLSQYKTWVTQHQALMDRLIKLLNGTPLQPQKGQFYHEGKITFEPKSLPQ